MKTEDDPIVGNVTNIDISKNTNNIIILETNKGSHLTYI